MKKLLIPFIMCGLFLMFQPVRAENLFANSTFDTCWDSNIDSTYFYSCLTNTDNWIWVGDPCKDSPDSCVSYNTNWEGNSWYDWIEDCEARLGRKNKILGVAQVVSVPADISKLRLKFTLRMKNDALSYSDYENDRFRVVIYDMNMKRVYRKIIRYTASDYDVPWRYTLNLTNHISQWKNKDYIFTLSMKNDNQGITKAFLDDVVLRTM